MKKTMTDDPQILELWEALVRVTEALRLVTEEYTEFKEDTVKAIGVLVTQIDHIHEAVHPDEDEYES